MNDDMFDARTYGLLAEFDSLGFLPTTLTLDPEKTAKCTRYCGGCNKQEFRR